jgi:predicted N-acetyltransferase YhbS
MRRSIPTPSRRLYDEVFGPGRFAKTAERLREGNTKIADASLVALDSDGVTGVVRVWPVKVGDKGRAQPSSARSLSRSAGAATASPSS